MMPLVWNTQATHLFIDPTNGDFRFKPELKFDGEGVAGDPRWWAN